MAATGLAEFFIGAIGGGAQGGLDAIIEKEKAAIQAARDEQLSRLRMQEHATNKAKDIELTDAQAARERDRTAGVVKEFQSSREAARLAAGATPPGGESDVRAAGENVGSVLPPAANPSKEDDARAFLDFVTARGEKGLTETAMKRIENERKWAHDDDTARRDTERTRELARANDMRERELQARIDGILSPGKGRGEANDLNRRKFEAKEWDTARKDVFSQFVITDPLDPGGKEKPDHAARTKVMQVMRGFEENSDFSPGEAAIITSKAVSQAFAAARKAFPSDQAKQDKYVDEGIAFILNREVKAMRPGMVDKPSDNPGAAPKSEPAKAPKAAEAKQEPAPKITAKTETGPAGESARERYERLNKELNDLKGGAFSLMPIPQSRKAQIAAKEEEVKQAYKDLYK